MEIQEVVGALTDKFASEIESTNEFRGEHTVTIKSGAIPAVLGYCRDELDFDHLADLTTIDNSGEDPRFAIAYELYSYQMLVSLRIKSNTPEDEAEFPTVTHLWKTANWHEREAYDMMGITFKGHPDLRRILMWEGYPYYPLRKEFPLAGKPSEMPDVAFSDAAPLDGGPFVTSPGGDTVSREPRARGEE